jgi:hypothetical protein
VFVGSISASLTRAQRVTSRPGSGSLNVRVDRSDPCSSVFFRVFLCWRFDRFTRNEMSVDN